MNFNIVHRFQYGLMFLSSNCTVLLNLNLIEVTKLLLES